MELGKITGSRIAPNRDSGENRRMLQVEMQPDDVRTVEQFAVSGEDYSPPVNSRVAVLTVSDSYKIGIGSSDGLVPEVEAGEREIYATDSPATEKLSRIKFSDKLTVENKDENLLTLLEDLIDLISDLQLISSAVMPGSKVQLEQLKIRVQSLLEA